MENSTDFSQNFMISCDWLQIHVKENEDILTKELPFYQFERTGQSKVWKNIYTITDTVTHSEIATYTKDANKCILPEGHGILKFDNAILYSNEDLKGYVNTFLERCNMQFVGVTRFDVAYDFQSFRNGLDPQEFISRYARNEVIRCGNKTNFSVYGKEMSRGLIYETLKIGSKSSTIKSKLYNKTAELKVNLKPWIEAAHKVNFKGSEDIPIWRLEFSIDSVTDLLRSNENPEENCKDAFKFHDLRILEIQNCYAIFQGLFNKKFRFKINGTNSRKTRMTDLELLVFDFPLCQLHFIKQNPMKKSSNRSTKIFLKQLSKFRNEVGKMDEEIEKEATDLTDYVLNLSVKKDCLEAIKRNIKDLSLDKVTEQSFENLIGKFLDIHGLRYWAHKNGISFTGHENYVNDLFEFQQIKFSEKDIERRNREFTEVSRKVNNEARELDRMALMEYDNYMLELNNK